MNLKKTARLLVSFGAVVSISLAAAHAAAGTQVPVKATLVKVSVKAVTIKLGDALLEEYQGGNPDNRTTTVRGEETARIVKPVSNGKKRS